MDKSDWQRIIHIRTHCDDIESFLNRFGRDFHTFEEDRAYFNAVSMCIFQIGELANGLSEDFRQKTSREIPWRMIRGMRNVLAHSYGEIDEEVIWETANNDIPLLKDFCYKLTSMEKEKHKSDRDER